MYDYNEIEYRPTLIYFLISFVGIFGNTLNLIILSQKPFIKISTFRFLFYLSIVDLRKLFNLYFFLKRISKTNVSLVVLTISKTDVLLKSLNVNMRVYSSFVCKSHTFFTYYLTHLSSIILMIVSIERAMLICDKNLFRVFSKKTNRNSYRYRSKSQIFYANHRIESIMLVLLITCKTKTFS